MIDICVVKGMCLSSDVIARATRMKVIMQYGVGLEGVDVTAATNHGIKVARIPCGLTRNAASCAEMAIYFMLGLLSKQIGLCCWSHSLPLTLPGFSSTIAAVSLPSSGTVTLAEKYGVMVHELRFMVMVQEV